VRAVVQTDFQSVDVARIAIELKGLPEYRNVALNDLIPIARQFLLDCQIDKERYDRRQRELPFEKAREDHQTLTKIDAAKYVTGDSRHPGRALKIFEELEQFLKANGKTIVSEGGLYLLGTCRYLKQSVYPWWKENRKRILRKPA
jgi:hypothetical protein